MTLFAVDSISTEYFIKDPLEGFGQVIHPFKYAYDLVIVAKKKTVLSARLRDQLKFEDAAEWK
jgi:hypothetical protein